MHPDTLRLAWLARTFKDFRFVGGASMDGHVPHWSCWSPAEGRTTRKTLRQAIDASMNFTECADPAAAEDELYKMLYEECEEPLPFATSGKKLAVQCHQLGLSSGDVIVGREVYGDPSAWSEARLTLLFIGQQGALFIVERRSNLLPEWRYEGESANWCLSDRHWIRTRKARPI